LVAGHSGLAIYAIYLDDVEDWRLEYVEFHLYIHVNGVNISKSIVDFTAEILYGREHFVTECFIANNHQK
jgi:hypothetical protein